MVSDHQVVVDGLGHAHKADLAADMGAVVGQLADGVHRVVAADVEEIADVQLFQDLEQLDVDGLALGGVPIRQLVAAAAQIAGRRALEQLNVQGGLELFIQHAGTALQQTRHAVQHAVDLAGTAALAALIHAGQAGIDDRSGTAGLTDDCIFCHSFSSCNFHGVGCAAGTFRQRTIIVMLSVPWSTLFFYCRSCRKFVRIFVQLCVPQCGTCFVGWMGLYGKKFRSMEYLCHETGQNEC